MTRLAFVFVGLALAACQSQTAQGGNGSTSTSSSGGGGALGKERSDCRPDHTCDAGLLCLSNLCVRPPAADCASVGEQLASLDLGNYAEPDERAPVVAKYKLLCEKVYVTKEQGQCLDKVRDKWAAAQCVAALYPDLAQGSACKLVTDKVTSAMQKQPGGYYTTNEQGKKYLAAMMKGFKTSCDEDNWSDGLKKCILAADLGRGVNYQYLPGCQMPPDVQQKLNQKVQVAIQEMNRG